jgi:tetratricopeptide (TPR) repeat protein
MALKQLAVVFAAALAVRLLHLWQMRDAPVFSVLMGDGRSYDEWARRIAAGDWFGTEVFYQAPLYPYFLGAVYTLLGRDLFVVRVCQALVGALSCVMLSLAAARMISRRAGLLAGLGLALYAPAVFFDALIQKTVLDVFFLCLAMLILSRVAGSPHRIGDWVCLGLALGCLSLTRENALVFVAVTLAWIAFRRVPAHGGHAGAEAPALRGDGVHAEAEASALRGEDVERTLQRARVTASARDRAGHAFRRQRAIEAGALLLGAAIVLLPVAARNYAVGGGFYVTTSQFGPNFYIGNNPRADGTYMSLRPGRGAPEYERQDATQLAEHALGRRLTPSEVSTYWSSRAWDFIVSQPGTWMRILLRKAVLLWNADEMLDTESQESHAEGSILLRVGGWFGHFGLLVPLALFGIVATWTDRGRLWVFYAMIVAYAASVMAFYVFARYRFPLVPLLMLFASAGLCALPDLIRADPPSRRAVLAASLAGVAIFVNWPVLSRETMRAVTENNLAVALQEAGRLDEAIGHYERAAALRPDYAPAYNNMGTALRAGGRSEHAVAAYERALELMPDYPDAHYNLANALLEQNRPREAADHLRTARRSLPTSAGVHNNLGKALAEQGRFDEAATELREAVALDPGSATAHRNLGNVLATRGNAEEALVHLRRASGLDPAAAEAGFDLGTLLLQLGRTDEAVLVFRAVVRSRPDYAEAHNNLGIALASQGLLNDAIEQFEHALRLNPGLADARRNLDMARRAVRPKP